MVEADDNKLAGVNPRVRVPVVVMPGNLSPGTVVTELVAAATAATVPPVATTDPLPEPVIVPEFTDWACTVKDPLAVFAAILQG